MTFSGEADKCRMMFHSTISLVTKCLNQGCLVFLIAVIVGLDRSILERIYRAITGEYYHQSVLTMSRAGRVPVDPYKNQTVSDCKLVSSRTRVATY